MRDLIKGFLISGVLILVFIGSALAESKIPVFVSILPQKWFVEKIGGELVDVKVMVLPGASPHTFEPKPRQMVSISKAKLYFSIGVEFEEVWLKKFAELNPSMKLVHTDEGIHKISMVEHHHGEGHHHHEEGHHEEGHDHHEEGHDHHEEDHHKEGHDHHEEGHHEEGHEHHEEGHHEHDHHGDHDEDHSGEGHAEGLDPHIWLSPSLVKHQAEKMVKALQQVDPSNRGVYQSNYNQFIKEIDLLDRELKLILKGKEGLQFLVFHPSWGYFAKDYGLKQIPIEIEGKDPKPAQLKELIEHAREEGIRVVFAQPQFSKRNARLVAKEIRGEVILIDPLAENWTKNLRHIAEQFKTALK